MNTLTSLYCILYYSMNANKSLLIFILRDWCHRVIDELTRNGIAPAPWQVAQTISECAKLIGQLEGEQREQQTRESEPPGSW